jgi:hypothetical protein
VAANDDGNVLLAWESNGQDGNSSGVFARAAGPTGMAFGGDLQINVFTLAGQSEPAVAPLGGGAFVVAWGAFGQDGYSQFNVMARRIRLVALATLDVDGNGLLQPLSDGLLNLRHRFGFSGASLTTGAVGNGCTRCAAADITAYLNGLNLTLDIDGNGLLEALTDGLLVLRFLFGFTGTALTANAVDTTPPNVCTRCDAATILPYLQTLD